MTAPKEFVVCRKCKLFFRPTVDAGGYGGGGARANRVSV